MIGPQRRVISAAFSVESSAKVSAFGQDGSAPSAAPAATSRTSPASAQDLRTRMGPPSDGRPPDAGGNEVTAHDHADDEQDHRRRLAVVEGADGVPEVEADAPAAHHADDRGRADVGLEAEEDVREEV